MWIENGQWISSDCNEEKFFICSFCHIPTTPLCVKTTTPCNCNKSSTSKPLVPTTLKLVPTKPPTPKVTAFPTAKTTKPKPPPSPPKTTVLSLLMTTKLPSEQLKNTGTKKRSIDCAVRSIVGDDPVEQATETIYILRNIYPWICGPNNENLDHLQKQYNVKINISLANSDKIVINEKCCCYFMLQVQHCYIRSILDEIFRQTDVIVEVPQENENNFHGLILHGDDSKFAAAFSLVNQKISLQDQVNTASEALEKEIEKLSNDHRSEIVRRKLNHDAIEKHDTLVPKLKNENGVQIDVPGKSTTSNLKMSTNAIASDQPLQVYNGENVQTKHDAKKCHDLQTEFNNTVKPYSKKFEFVTLKKENNRVNEIIMNLETCVQNDTTQLQNDEKFGNKNDSNSTKFGIPSFNFLFDGRFGIEIYENGTTKMLNDWTPLYLSMAEKSIKIGETAKTHFRDFPNFVIYDILKIIGKPINEIKIDPKWGFEIIENSGILFFQIQTQNGIRMIPEEMVLAAFFKTMKSRTETYLNENIKEIYLSTNFKVSESQKNIFKKAALKVNLEIKTFDFIDYQ
uniref:C-type lectin domain-containing protein n=1 Tax=Panagrolaimus sp. PS1159 TaxID=55785 RepID=A0AC35FX99_9BILA